MTEMTVRRGREGSRWINERPGSHEVAEWFKTVRLHAGMDHEKYVGGITLIPGKEKADEIAGYDANGRPVIVEDVVNLTFTPYMKVETRVAYFHDYARAIAEEWGDGVVTTIRPVAVPRSSELGLPEGFFAYRASGPKGEVSMIGARYYVAITTVPTFVRVGIGEAKFEAQSITIVEGYGTKTVPVATRWDVDLNAVEKAETGAIGRALGVAGMLVLPGSGVATAEDMLEAMGPAPAASSESAELPADAALAQVHLNDDELRERAAELLRRLEEFPPVLEDFREWAKSRGHTSLATITSPALKGFVRKLEKALDAAQRDARPEG